MKPVSPSRKTVALFGIGALLAVCTARLFLTLPSLIHSNMLGAALLDSILQMGGDPREEYGPVSFWVLGALASIFGPSFENIVFFNHVFAVLGLGMMGWVGSRFTGKLSTGFLVLGLGALDPILMRIGGSEDAHNLGAFLGAMALLTMDFYIKNRRLPLLLLSTLLGILMIYTRQTYYPWGLLLVAWGAIREGQAFRPQKEWWVSAFLLSTLVLYRSIYTVTSPSDKNTFVLIVHLLADPATVLNLLKYHPITDIGRFGPFPMILGSVGAYIILRKGRGGALFFAGVVGYFLISLPFGPPIPADEFGFRLPFYMIWQIMIGIGATSLLEKLRQPLQFPGALVLVAAAMGFQSLLPGAALPREVSTVTQEYRAVRKLAEQFSSSVSVVSFTTEKCCAPTTAPHFHVPQRPLRDAGVALNLVPMKDLETWDFEAKPIYFFHGAWCSAWSLPELVAPEKDANFLDAAKSVVRHSIARRLPEGVVVPTVERDECIQLRKRSTLSGDQITINLADENPFALFIGEQTQVGFYRIHAIP